MIEARDRSGKMLMTAQHFRFGGSAKAMKAEIDMGVLGDVYHARSWMLRRSVAPVTPGFAVKELSGGGPCIDIGVHILDLTLWFMGHPEPATVSGVARAALAHEPGATFSTMSMAEIPEEFDVEDFATAFIRFDSGATMTIEISWLLHYPTLGEERQVWLYGTQGDGNWPKCEFYSSNTATRQFYNTTLQLTSDQLEPHAQECVEFARAIFDEALSPVPRNNRFRFSGSSAASTAARQRERK